MTTIEQHAEYKPARLVIKMQTAYAVLFVFLLLTIYTEIPLYLTDTFFIPSFMTILSAPLLFLVCRRSVYKYDAFFLFSITAILLLTAFLSPGREFIAHKLSGVIQTSTSIFIGILLFKLTGILEKAMLKKILFFMTIILVAGTFLEIFGIIKGVSDWFRELVYTGGYKVYDNDARDMAITGFSRPKFFTSEPSLLAIGFLVFLNSWLILSFSRRNFLFSIFLTVLMLYAVGSPILLISLVITLLTILLKIKNTLNRLVLSAIAVSALLMFAMILFFTTDLWFSIAKRFDLSILHASSYTLTSENLRMVFPYITMVDILKNSPFFGTGVSGKDVISIYSSLPIEPIFAFGNNNFATMFIYLGLIGTILFSIAFRSWLKRRGVLNVFLLAVILTGFSQSMGAFESPRFWGYVFLFIGVMAKSAEGQQAVTNTNTHKESMGQ